MTGGLRWLVLVLALASGACTSLSETQRARALHIAEQARSIEITCHRADACAEPSPLRALATRAFAESAPQAPRHYALLLEYGQDALLARLNLIRSARRTIDLQTYIFDEDDAGHLVLDELLAAARRGVRVRVLVDQLAALRHVDTLAALAGVHANFELRLYNPVLGRAHINYPQYVLAAACCWRQLNQRMHSKLLLVDNMVGITGGRNYQNDYFDWDDSYNFRDRDILVAGLAATEMASNFKAFWQAPQTRRIAELVDVGHRILRQGVPKLPRSGFALPERAQRMARDATDEALVRDRLAVHSMAVGDVEFIGDLPQKHHRAEEGEPTASTHGLRELLESTQHEVLLQTPYLVLSPPAQDLFRVLHARTPRPRVIVSTNSLAATDAFITYALSYKYRRRFVRDFGFEIHEFKPFPQDAPIDLDATGTVGIAWEPDGTPVFTDAPQAQDESQNPARKAPLEREYSALRWSGFSANNPVKLEREGVRFGLHAKSMVIDERIGVVGTHNFDPRGDSYNTESVVVIDDPAFARVLAASIRRDIEPSNSWTVARRDKLPVFSGLDYSLTKISERLPIFDLWPTRYATDYQFQPGPDCPMPLPLSDPRFRQCYEPVGDFPEVEMGLRSLLTRIFTAFGAGLAPIL